MKKEMCCREFQYWSRSSRTASVELDIAPSRCAGGSSPVCQPHFDNMASRRHISRINGKPLPDFVFYGSIISYPAAFPCPFVTENCIQDENLILHVSAVAVTRALCEMIMMQMFFVWGGGWGLHLTWGSVTFLTQCKVGFFGRYEHVTCLKCKILCICISQSQWFCPRLFGACQELLAYRWHL